MVIQDLDPKAKNGHTHSLSYTQSRDAITSKNLWTNRVIEHKMKKEEKWPETFIYGWQRLTTYKLCNKLTLMHYVLFTTNIQTSLILIILLDLSNILLS